MAMNEEARKCVQALQNSIRNGFYWIGNAEFSMPCKGMIHLIESLSAQLDQVTRERDAAFAKLESIDRGKGCATCSLYKPRHYTLTCKTCKKCDKWQWRGVEV